MSYGGRSLGGLSDDGPAPGRGRSASLTPPGARPPRPPNDSASSTRDPQTQSFGSQSSGVKSRSPPLSKSDPPPMEFWDELNGDFQLPVSVMPLDEADGPQGWQVDPYAHGEENDDDAAECRQHAADESSSPRPSMESCPPSDGTCWHFCCAIDRSGAVRYEY